MLLDFIFMFLDAAAKSGKSEEKLKNENNAAYVQTQSGGYFTLGSSSRRFPVKRTQIAKLQLPSIHADCSGIDIFKGGFSFINEQAILDMLKSIGSGAKAFAFNLALETVSPQIASTIKWAQDIAQKVNLANIGSCEGAAALLGAVAPRNTKLHENTCKLMSSNTGRVTDFVKGRAGCESGGANRTSSQTKIENELHAMGEATNIAWYVINKDTGWNQTLKETIMSITGTVITTAPDTRDQSLKGGVEIFEPLALNDDFFNAFVKGGQIEMYRCSGDSKKCLAITKESRHISFEDTHVYKVSELLLAIEDKIYTDTPLADEEKALIADTQIPILKIINIMSAYQRGKAPISIHAYAEIIANDLLTQHVRQIITLVRQIASEFKHLQINAEPLQNYIKQLNLIDHKLHMRQLETNHKVEQILQIIQKTKLLERELFGNMRVVAGG